MMIQPAGPSCNGCGQKGHYRNECPVSAWGQVLTVQLQSSGMTQQPVQSNLSISIASGPGHTMLLGEFAFKEECIEGWSQTWAEQGMLIAGLCI